MLFFDKKSQYKYVILFVLTFASVIDVQRAQRSRTRFCSKASVPNASVRLRHNNKIMRINCDPGFTLQGSNIVGCKNGKWNSDIPVCTKAGCSKPDTPEHGLVIPTRFQANLYCKESYKLVGGRVTYCNGTHWDRPLGKCQETDNKTQLSCDFESEDLCGWSHDETHNFDWKRVMAANLFQLLRTGPQHDHTTFTADAGHYMLMESFDQLPNSAARLISPIYSKELTNIYGCFKFFYFMYGAAVGSLNVYIKPVSVNFEQMLEEPSYKHFSLSGNQKNIWKEGVFIIKQLSEDFQIILEGTAGINHLSDIAIDDVEIMPYYECTAFASTGTTGLPEVTDYAIFDVQSCEGRCSETNSSRYGITQKEGVLFKSCDCHEECENLNTCCPNYRSLCEFGNTETSTEWNDYSKISPSTEITKVMPTTVPQLTSITTRSSDIISDSKPITVASVSTHIPTVYKKASETTRPVTLATKVKSELEITMMTTAKFTEFFKTVPSSIRPASTIITQRTTESAKAALAKQNSYQILPEDKPELNPTSENVLLLRKDKYITWQVSSNAKKNTENSGVSLLSLTIIIVTISIIGLALKHHRWMKSFIQRYSNRLLKNDYGDATVLIYNQNSDIVV